MRSRAATIDEAVRARLRTVAAEWVPPTTHDLPLVDAPDLSPAQEEPPRWHVALDARALRALVVVLCVLALGAAWVWWQGIPREVLAVPGPLASAASPAGQPGPAGEVYVHVIGQVRKPGLLHLPAGSRVADAIEAAGGARDEKALSSVNLARVLVDGEQLAVGVESSSKPSAGLSLNSASAQDFEALPGIGPVLAARIVSWRDTNGPFRSVDELGEVSGIGDALLRDLRSLVHV